MPDIELYKENPAKFVQECYSEWSDHYDKNISETDRLAKNFFLNYDEDLAKRKADRWLDASALFIPMIQPHVLSRVSQFVAFILSGDPRVKWQSLPGTPAENAEHIQKLVLNRMFGNEAEDTTKLSELLTAAEIRKTAWVKVTTEKDNWEELTIEPDQINFGGFTVGELEEMNIQAPLPTEPLGSGSMKRVLKTVEGEEHPTWDLLPEKAFFYDPYPWRKKQWLYCGDMKYVTEAYLRQKERTGIYKDINHAIKMGEQGGDGTGYPDDTSFNRQSSNHPDNFSYASMSERGNITHGREKVEHTHQLKECHALVPKQIKKRTRLPAPHAPFGETSEWTGDVEIRIITTVNDVEVANRPKPFMQIEFPYVGFKAIAVPNQMEGISTAEMELDLQPAVNAFYNNAIDAGRYAVFSPLQMDSKCKVVNDAVWAPNRIWKVEGMKEYGGIQPMVNPQSLQGISYNMAFARTVEEKGENVSASTDLILGTRNVKSDRTLGETQIRHQSTMSRINLTLTNYAAGLIEICDMFEKIYQERIPLNKPMEYFSGQYGEQGEAVSDQVTFDQIKGRFKKTMPHVAEYVDSTTAQMMWTMLYDRLNQDPSFMNPMAHYKLLRRFLEAYKVKDIDDLLQSPPEMEGDQLIQLLMNVFGKSNNIPSEVNPTLTTPPEGTEPKLGLRASM